MFVLQIRPHTREVVVGNRDELFEDVVDIGGLNWLAEPPTVGDRVNAQLRYRAAAVPAVVTRIDESLTLELAEPQLAVSPGQSAVLFGQSRARPGWRKNRKALQRERWCSAGP